MSEHEGCGNAVSEELVSEEVEGYDIHRSLVSNNLFSLFAVNYMNQILYPVVVDVEFEYAVSYKEAYSETLNKSKD